MPNTLVRAAAEGMPAIDRRRMLLGLAAASTAAAAVTVATPAPAAVTENPELVRLGDQLPVAVAELEAAQEEIEWIVAEWKHRWPLAPDEITLRRASPYERCAEKDIAYRPLLRPGADYPRAVRSIQNVKSLYGQVADRKWRANVSPARLARNKATLAKMRCEMEICKTYHAEVDAIREASGIDAALARVDLGKLAILKLAAAIIDQQERSMDGLLIKAQAVNAVKAAGMQWQFLETGSRLADSIVRLAEGGAV